MNLEPRRQARKPNHWSRFSVPSCRVGRRMPSHPARQAKHLGSGPRARSEAAPAGTLTAHLSASKAPLPGNRARFQPLDLGFQRAQILSAPAFGADPFRFFRLPLKFFGAGLDA